jgi:gamma-glutamylcyclotransferase (GGCT)/AIG2-like uncharacterized protein YtfP
MQENNFEHILFVYGTLKKGYRAHYLLEKSTYLGVAITKPCFQLFSCFSYPALVRSSVGYKVSGELYGLSEVQKKIIDDYEGVDYGLYQAEPIEIAEYDLLENINLLDGQIVLSYIYYGNLAKWQQVLNWP